MRRLCVSFFLTLVLIQTFAPEAVAQEEVQTNFPENESIEPKSIEPKSIEPESIDNETTGEAAPASPDRRELDSLDLVRPPVNKNKRPMNPAEVFYAYREALTLRVGAFSPVTNAGADAHSLIGAQYFFTTLARNSFEIGADLIARNSSRLQGSMRWVTSREAFRPYTKLGLALVVPAQERLVSFLKLQNYRLVGAAGFEILVSRANSFRADLEAAAGSKDVELDASVGYVWAW